MQALIKKNWSTILLSAFVLLMLFSPGAKAFVLKVVLKTGLLNADVKKEIIDGSNIQSLSFSNGNGIPAEAAALKGKTIFVNFWATWCPPCIAEMSSINNLYNKLAADSSIVFILVDADGNLSAASTFMQKNGYTLPVYRLTANISPTLYNGTLPTSLIIDKRGNVVYRHEGIANYDTDAIIGLLQSP